MGKYSSGYLNLRVGLLKSGAANPALRSLGCAVSIAAQYIINVKCQAAQFSGRKFGGRKKVTSDPFGGSMAAAARPERWGVSRQAKGHEF
jgi:hypothetical protein